MIISSLDLAKMFNRVKREENPGETNRILLHLISAKMPFYEPYGTNVVINEANTA